MRDEFQDEHAEMIPAIGKGVIMHPDDTRYRIVDVWHVYPKRGALQPHGIHAFLEVADVPSDRPRKLHPDCYGDRSD